MLTNTADKQIFIGNGVTVVFAIPHAIITLGSDEVEVILRDESDPLNPTEDLQVITADYTLTGGTPPTDVTMNVAPTADQKLLIRRKFPLTQPTDYLGTSQFPAETHEKILDRNVAMIQMLNEIFSRLSAFAPSSPTSNKVMPEPQASELLGWNALGTEWQLYSVADLFAIISGFGVTNSYTILDGTGPIPLANETIDGAVNTSAVYEYEIVRGITVFANGKFYMQYLNGAWRVEDAGSFGDLSGLSFTVSQVTTVGTLEATIDSGAGNATLKLYRKLY